MNISEPPLVSVITPAFNLAEYLEETIRSVQSQTYGHWEMIIGDDGSEDETAEIAEGLANEDPRIKVHRLSHAGLPAVARNRALAFARGEFIAFLDGDDLWRPDKLERQLRGLNESGCGWGFANTRHIGDSQAIGYPTRWRPAKPFFPDLLTGSGSIPCPTLIVRSDLLRQVCPGGELSRTFDERARIKAVEDWDLALRLARESEPYYDARVIAYYRVHPGGISRSYEKNFLAAAALIEKYREQGVQQPLIERALDLHRSKLAMNRLLATDEPWRRELWSSTIHHLDRPRNLVLAVASLLPTGLARHTIKTMLDMKHQ